MDALAPRLAKLVGGYCEMRPVPALQAHIRCAWMQLIPAGPVAPIVVLPDGCVDIVWSEDRLSVAGPDLSAAVLPLPPGSAVFGLRFRPGAAANWLGLPISVVADQRPDLADLWGRRARDLAEMAGEAAAPAEGLARLQAGLAEMAHEIEPPARDIALVFRSFAQGEGMPSLLGRLGVSERNLRRRCHAAFGYGPKTLERILRFQRFVTLLRQSPGLGLSAAALAAGYADQAHLSREARALSGFSPREIRRQLTA
jgi:AraC-like DNA-binding protein